MKSVKRNNNISYIRNILFILLFPLSGVSQDSIVSDKTFPLQIHGYVKNLQSAFFRDEMSSLVTVNLIHNRLNFSWQLPGNLFGRLEVRNRLYYGEQVKMTYKFGEFIDSDRGLIDLSHNIVDDSSVVFNTTIDRLLLNWSNSKWDITFGRQRINWGVNMVWNPNDIFNAFNYFDFDYEERPGTDAIRVQYNSQKKFSWEFAFKLSDKQKEQVGALMHKINVGGYDLQSFAGIYFEDIILGTGWAGNIKNTGFKGEVSYFHPYKKANEESGTLSASLSSDRSFKNDYFVMAAYLYNSNASNIIHGVNNFTGESLSAKNLMPFDHSFFVRASKSINPIVIGSIASIFSPKYKTVILLPSFSVSMSQDWDVSLIAQSFFSDVSGVYRSLGNGIYLRLRWSF